MPLILNPWAILIAVGLLLGTHWGAYWKGLQHQKDRHAAVELVRLQTIEAAQEGTAKAIAAIEWKQTTIRQVVEKETHENAIYRGDCIHPDSVLRQLNEALAAESSGAVALPEADAAGRSDVRRDDTETARGHVRVLPVQGGGTRVR